MTREEVSRNNTEQSTRAKLLQVDLQELQRQLQFLRQRYGAYYHIEEWQTHGARMYKMSMTLKIPSPDTP